MSARILPIVAVVGGADARQDSSEFKYALEFGKWIANHNYHLLTGGGGGIMLAASRGFVTAKDNNKEALGYCIGILPAKTPGLNARNRQAKDGYPNGFVEIPIYTHLGNHKDGFVTSRNPINIFTSDLVVGFPGGKGTLDEVTLALRADKPTAVFAWSEDKKNELKTSLQTNGIEMPGFQDFDSLPALKSWIEEEVLR